MKRILPVIFLLVPLALQAAKPASDYFPELKGWKKPSEIKTYTPENLWNIIDGAAESYISYDFQELYMGDYRGKKGSYITLEIYRHQTPENAFGIYRSEKPSDFKPVSVGAEGYSGEDFLNFITGCFYVKIRSQEVAPAVMESMNNLAKMVCEKLGGNNSLPEPLNWFPDENKVAGSEMYINSNFLGYSFFNKAFTAEYNINSARFTSFIITMPDRSAALQVVKEYLTFLRSDEIPQEKRYLLNDKYNGLMVLSVKGSCILGIFNTEDRETAQTYLEMLEKKTICR